MNELQRATRVGSDETGRTEGLPSGLAMRLIRRGTAPIGVIDTRHPEGIYARTATWLSKRFPLLDQVMARYRNGDGSLSGPGGFVFKSMAEPSGNDEEPFESSPVTVLPRLTESPFPSSPGSLAGENSPSSSRELFRVSRRLPRGSAGLSSASGVSKLHATVEEKMPRVTRSVPRAKEREDTSVEPVRMGQAGFREPLTHQASSIRVPEACEPQAARSSVSDSRLPRVEGMSVLQKTSLLPQIPNANSLRQPIKTGESSRITNQSPLRHTILEREGAHVAARPGHPIADHGQRDVVVPLPPRNASPLVVTEREGSQVEQKPWPLTHPTAIGQHPRQGERELDGTVPVGEQARTAARPGHLIADHGQRDVVVPLPPRNASPLVVTEREGSQVQQKPWPLTHPTAIGQYLHQAEKDIDVTVPSFSEEAHVRLPLQLQSKSQRRRVTDSGGQFSRIVGAENHAEAILSKARQMVWQKQTRSTKEEVEEVVHDLGRQAMLQPNHDAATFELAPGSPTQTHMAPQPAMRPQEVTLDIGAIAEKVSRVIARQLIVERERRGVSGWH